MDKVIFISARKAAETAVHLKSRFIKFPWEIHLQLSTSCHWLSLSLTQYFKDRNKASKPQTAIRLQRSKTVVHQQLKHWSSNHKPQKVSL